MIYVPKNLPSKYSAIFIYATGTVTTKQLIKSMRLNDTQHTRKLVNDCIMYLLDQGILSGKKICQNKYELYRPKMDLKVGAYYSVDYDDINAIMDIKDKCNRLDLIDYYLVLTSTINYHTRVGFTSIATLSGMCGLTPATVNKYNKILIKNKIIYIKPSRRQGVTNRYGRYVDRLTDM